MEALAPLGATSALLARGRPTHGAQLFEAGRLVTTADTRILDVRFPFSLSLPQYELEEVLEQVARTHGVDVFRGTEAIELRAAPQGTTVVLDEAAPVTARWVVGCDGGGSLVRQAIGSSLRGWTREGLALADVVSESPLAYAELHTGPDGLVIRLPLRETQRWVAEGGPDQVCERVRDRLACAPPADVLWSSPFKLHARLATRWRRGPILLAGDAAHLHSPVGGHGMNTGLFDAADLAWKLALVHQGRAPEALLDSYARSRRRAARWSVLAAWGATIGLRARSAPLRYLRSAVAATGARLAPHHTTAWSIGWDVTVPGIDRARGGPQRAGRRVIDVPTGSGWLLDGLKTLTVFGDPAGLPPWVERRPLPPGVFGDARSALVRPDGFLAYRGPSSGLSRAFTALLGGRA